MDMLSSAEVLLPFVSAAGVRSFLFNGLQATFISVEICWLSMGLTEKISEGSAIVFATPVLMSTPTIKEIVINLFIEASFQHLLPNLTRNTAINMPVEKTKKIM